MQDLPKDYLSPYLKSFKFLCYATYSKRNTIAIMVLILKFIWLASVLKELFGYSENIIDVSSSLDAIATLCQNSIRDVTMFLYSKLIFSIIEDRRNDFWPYEYLGKEKGAEMRKMLLNGRRISVVLASVGVIIGALLIIASILDKKLPLKCWFPVTNPYIFYLTLIVQGVLLEQGAAAVFSFEGTFVTLCRDIEVQFIFMNNLISGIDFSKDTPSHCTAIIKTCVEQSIKVLRIRSKLDKWFGLIFLIQYLMAILTCSSNFYIIMIPGISPIVLIRCVVYSFFCCMQAAIIYEHTERIIDKAETFSESIYNLKWYENGGRNIRNDIMICLIKSQQSVNFVGTGLLNINRALVLQIVRISFSIASLLQQLQQVE